MNEALVIVFAAFVGFISGLFFFGGLWYTVQRFPTWENPAIWVLLSFLIRTSVVLVAIYLVGGDSLPRMGGCLVGFLCGRLFMLRVTREKPAEVSERKEEGNAA